MPARGGGPRIILVACSELGHFTILGEATLADIRGAAHASTQHTLTENKAECFGEQEGQYFRKTKSQFSALVAAGTKKVGSRCLLIVLSQRSGNNTQDAEPGREGRVPVSMDTGRVAGILLSG